jgi:histidine triad (HIT) family protein
MPEELAAKVFVLAKKIATVMKEVTGCDGVNILQNNGETAGQTVFHFHMHIIPRYKDSKNNDILKWNAGELNQKMVDGFIEKAKELL